MIDCCCRAIDCCCRAIDCCCRVGSEECLRQLVTLNADPNLGNWSGKSALSRASMHGEINSIEVQLSPSTTLHGCSFTRW